VQQIVSRSIDPMQPAVVTIGAIHGGNAPNVIAGSLNMTGTVRAFSSEVRGAMPERIERVLRACCDISGAEADFKYDWRFPVTENDAEQTRYARRVASALGEDRVLDIEPLTGSEDFSFFAQRVPACFFALGSQGGPTTANAHHSSTFDIDERALEVGVQMMTSLALDAPRNAP
ncbi:MAG: M20/M25/M40 family metallo-hydrolase, partial [Candidatus Eremiobacteraeota bacterium]|nr:M20/M25/M40 family metallo-hydrolase [Candidatus Eremiobacteraeota bacterium]